MPHLIVAGVLLIALQELNEAEIGSHLENLKAGSVSERVAAAKSLGTWVCGPQKGAEAFSDRSAGRLPSEPRLPSDLYDRTATALARAADAAEPTVKDAASQALVKIYGTRHALQAPLLRALQSKEKAVVGYVLQAFERVEPEAEVAMPALITILGFWDEETRGRAAQALGRYGHKARAAVPALMRQLPGVEISPAPWSAITAMTAIGIDEEQAKTLAALKFPSKSYLEFSLFETLLAHPDIATAFLQARPKLLEKCLEPHSLLKIVESRDPKRETLRKALLDRSDLPPIVMAWSGEPRFLPLIRERLKTSDKHGATLLAACSRACGAPGERVVKLSEKETGDFKPKSLWPGTDSSREGNGSGCGCGIALVLITGHLQMADGSPAIEPRFVNENDRALLGLRVNEAGPLRYDPKTGRFVFYTTVFAAYSNGEQPGPYQTGTAKVRIEAAGARPLVVRFYDEMPDVKVTLSPVK